MELVDIWFRYFKIIIIIYVDMMGFWVFGMMNTRFCEMIFS